LRSRDFYVWNDKLYVNFDFVGFPCERETEASRSQFGPEQRSTSSWSVSFAAIHGPRATDIWRRCDLQLRVKPRQDKRNLSFSLGPIGSMTCSSVRINRHSHPRKKTNFRFVV